MTSPASPLDLNDIQGDILGPLPKRAQTYHFYQIKDVNLFRTQLAHFSPLVKTVAQVIKDRQAIEDHKRKHEEDKPELIPMVGVNIAWSKQGLIKIGVVDDVQDASFTNGQREDAKNLGDNGTTVGSTFTPDWEKPFLEVIDLVILVAGDSHETINRKLYEVEDIFGIGTSHSSLHEVTRLRGNVRPGSNKGHEHFGFLDGISNPAISGFDKNPFPGQETVQDGIVIVGFDGDSHTQRPSWMKGGSFLALRQLKQNVVEFNKFLDQNSITSLPGDDSGSELLGARMVGRWKSGAPVDISPLKDDPKLGVDPLRNNNFSFKGETNDQSRCPFSAHVRKVNPREDLESHGISTAPHRMLRRGIPYGPEVSELERLEGKTQHNRGLIFVAYSSSIDDGFHFVQTQWANNIAFPPFQSSPTPGIDPLIGQVGGGAARPMSGTNPSNLTANLLIPQLIIPRGGEYFFSPSISTIKNTFAESVHVE